MREMVDLLDTSNYVEDHPLFSNKNKKTPGKFKDELGGKYYVTILVTTGVYNVCEEIIYHFQILVAVMIFILLTSKLVENR